MTVNDQSVEQWARTAHFSQPVRFGEVEAGVLARKPGNVEPLPWWVPALGLVGWFFVGVSFLLGMGVTLLGLLFVWLGTRDGVLDDGWLAAAQWVFVCGALAQGFYLAEVWKARLREWLDWTSALVVLVASVGSRLLLDSADRQGAPLLLRLGIVVAAVLAVAQVLVSVLRGRPRKVSTRKPPPRGPRTFNDQVDYQKSREFVLDILTERGLVTIDEADRRRLHEMPLGYWEEIDGVDERERRRILEHRFVGWREFDESDGRSWPPEQR